MTTKIKICGITREQDLHCAAELGIWAAGINTVSSSPRCVVFEHAERLIHSCREFGLEAVLVVAGELNKDQLQLAAIFPDITIQFHGRESAAYCRNIGHNYIKVMTADTFDAAAYSDAYALLVDAGTDNKALGGSGETWDWNRVGIQDRRLIVAGGLTPANVAGAIAAVRPWAVDIASGAEERPGIKSRSLMQALARAVATADNKAQNNG